MNKIVRIFDVSSLLSTDIINKCSFVFNYGYNEFGPHPSNNTKLRLLVVNYRPIFS